MAEVAIAVVSWNTRTLLERCLDSMKPDADTGLTRVWVVDNGSTDGSAEMVEKQFPWVELVRSDENLGFGRAVNLVAERTDEPWIAASNADIETLPGCIPHLLERGTTEPGVGIVAPQLVMPDGNVQHSVHSFPSIRLGLVVNLGIQRIWRSLGDRLCLEGLWDSSRSREVDWAHGALLLIKREAFEEGGGFDSRQWMYAEDIDIAWRLRRIGWNSFYEVAAQAKHEVSAATVKAFGFERERRHIEAAYIWMARRRGFAVSWLYALIGFTGAAARWLILTPAAVLMPQRFGPPRRAARRYMGLHRIGLRAPRKILRPG